MGGGENPCAGARDVPGVGAQVEEKVVCCVGDGNGPVVVVGDCYESIGQSHCHSWLLLDDEEGPGVRAKYGLVEGGQVG